MTAKRIPENSDKIRSGAWAMIEIVVLLWGGILGGLYIYTTWDTEPDKVITAAPVKMPIIPAKVEKPNHIADPGKKVSETIYMPHFPKTGGIVYTVR